MGLAEFQHALARLSTDRPLRESFFADPAAVGPALGLDAEEAQRLAALPAAQLEVFAGTLHQKRIAEAARLLPLTSAVLDRGFAPLFRRHAGTYVPRGTRKHGEDARAFALFLEDLCCRERVEPPWIVDLARYEAAWLEATEPACRCLTRRFRYPVHHLARSLARGENPLCPPRPVLAFWLRLPRAARPWHFVLAPPWLS